MNGAHLHLILTHIPIVGMPLTLFLFLWGQWRSSLEIERAAFFAFGLLACLTVWANSTGEGAESVLKALPDYPRPWVHQHEAMADKASIATVVTGLLSLVALLWKGSSKKFTAVILCSALVSSFLLVAAGALGGQIRHVEIRKDRLSISP